MSILKPDFTYVDLFSGIGGFRWAMENYSSGKAKCLYASEIDPFAARVYEANFGQKPFGDIRQLNPLAVDSLSLSLQTLFVAVFLVKHFLRADSKKDSRILVGPFFAKLSESLNAIRLKNGLN